jgi:predicted metal-dependent enzyme (double-stranded beta helix superfamily)
VFLEGNVSRIGKLRSFVVDVTRLIESAANEATILAEGRERLADLVAEDDWLPEAYAQPHPKYYQQYLLYGDPLERLSVVSFVWGPGQETPVHNHRVWGMVGMLRGAEVARNYGFGENGLLVESPPERLERGAVTAVSPTIGDIHRISNAYTDRVSISIHVYGGNIGSIRRSVFDIDGGLVKEFVSGYSNDAIPNLWTL